MTSEVQQGKVDGLVGKTVQVHEYGRPTTRGVVEHVEVHEGSDKAVWLTIRNPNGTTIRHYDCQPGSKVEVVE